MINLNLSSVVDRVNGAAINERQNVYKQVKTILDKSPEDIIRAWKIYQDAIKGHLFNTQNVGQSSRLHESVHQIQRHICKVVDKARDEASASTHKQVHKILRDFYSMRNFKQASAVYAGACKNGVFENLEDQNLNVELSSKIQKREREIKAFLTHVESEFPPFEDASSESSSSLESPVPTMNDDESYDPNNQDGFFALDEDLEERVISSQPGNSRGLIRSYREDIDLTSLRMNDGREEKTNKENSRSNVSNPPVVQIISPNEHFKAPVGGVDKPEEILDLVKYWLAKGHTLENVEQAEEIFNKAIENRAFAGAENLHEALLIEQEIERLLADENQIPFLDEKSSSELSHSY